MIQDDIEDQRPKAKRARVAIACQRCKTRKQKCDGEHPSCSNCLSFGISPCVYTISENRQANKNRRALEQRVRELESALAKASSKSPEQGNQSGFEPEHQHHSASYTRRRSRSGVDGNLSTPGASMSLPRPHADFGFQVRSHAQTTNCSPGTEMDEFDNMSSVTGILRELSIEAGGGYIGASSNFAMGRVITSLVGSERRDSLSNLGENLSPRSFYQPSAPTCASDINKPNLMEDPNCDQLLLSYLEHISLRWPLLRTSYLRSLHQERASLNDRFGKSILHMVYSIGGRFLETTGQSGAFYAEEHYTAALQELQEILQYHDIRSVQFLLLLAIHDLRAPKGPGAWTHVGLAIRICIDQGFHRQHKALFASLADLELRKRVFWTAYCLDRQLSIIMGRPFAISDHDIDAELPLDLDEDVEEETLLRQVQQGTQIPTHRKPTSMSCFIHITRLRIIESRIQQSVYRVDAEGAPRTEVDGYLRQLEEWRTSMPNHDGCTPDPYVGVDSGVALRDHETQLLPKTCCRRVYQGVCESQMVYYYKCIRFLLYPYLLSGKHIDPACLQKCVDACGGVCQTYKRLHQKSSVGFSLMALHSIFLAGLTLVYCVWISPEQAFGLKSSNDLNACSIVLYIIAERWPAAKKYRDVFDNIKQTVLESIEEHGLEGRKVITSLRPTLQDTLSAMREGEEGRQQFEAMLVDMAGENPFLATTENQSLNHSPTKSLHQPGQNEPHTTVFPTPSDQSWDFDTSAIFEFDQFAPANFG
ncbi:hypothetical protein DM02DRAFT_632338 [Periconia macrospinosa]|uniref:Zn(2)-C6 fungal-type domain-containing protein n=1 Tax=Periconia macrospinosa TaxID=97972 RepID=A0A2V1DEK1_9PLEO|nr:hypothetical protein DM02DRAFT_632338 [Periconia macrospinosa]